MTSFYLYIIESENKFMIENLIIDRNMALKTAQ